MRGALFLLAVVAPLAALLATAQTKPVYLDADAATLKLTDMKPGDYISVRLDYDVGFSVLGDEEHKDAEIAFTAREGAVRIWVGLGNDNVVARVYRGGEVVWEKELARQTCWYGCGASGSVEAKLVETCEGQVLVYVGGDQVASFTVDPTVALTVMKDNDATLLSQGSAYKCEGNGDVVGYNPGTPLLAKAAIAGGLAIAALAGAALAARG